MTGHIRNFSPHVHGVLFMPKDLDEVIKGVSNLSGAGVDDIWLIASDISTTLMGLQAIRMAIKSNHAGVFGLPLDMGARTCAFIAERCNFWRFWTQTSDIHGHINNSATWFSNLHPTEPISRLVDVACCGNPLAQEPGSEKDTINTSGIAQAALCGHITPEIVREHGHAFGFYVISPYAGRDPNLWPLHADIDLVRAICEETMVLREELAEGMDVIR